jgi:hypothetical protein
MVTKEKAWLDPKDADDLEKTTMFKKIVKAMVKDAPHFCHGVSTCTVEGLNAERTFHAPKTKEFARTYKYRAHVAPTKRNLGGIGKVFMAVMQKPGVQLSAAEQEELNKLDEKTLRKNEKKKTHEYKKREGELELVRKKRSVREKKTAKYCKRSTR